MRRWFYALMAIGAAVIGLHLLGLLIYFGLLIPQQTWSAFWQASPWLVLAYGACILGAGARWAKNSAWGVTLSLSLLSLFISFWAYQSQGPDRPLPLAILLLGGGLICFASLVVLHRPLRGRLALLALMSGLCFLGLELSLTYFYDPTGLSQQIERQNLQFNRLLIVETDQGFGHRPQQSFRVAYQSHQGQAYDVLIQTNDIGLRDQNYPQAKAPGNFRIIMAGDSVVFGVGVNLEETLPKQLGQALALQQASLSYEVMNWGVAGFNIEQSLQWLEVGQASSYQPDLLIMGITLNDLPQAADPNTFNPVNGLIVNQQADAFLEASLGGGLSQSRVYFFMKPLWASLSQRERRGGLADPEFIAPQTVQAAREDLAATINYAKALGVPLVFVLFPDERLFIGLEAEQRWQQTLYETFLQLLQASGYPYLDAIPLFEQAHLNGSEPLFLKNDPIHFSAAGHRLLAADLGPFLLPLLPTD
jgi:lysophospholipase L1-like esterase